MEESNVSQNNWQCNNGEMNYIELKTEGKLYNYFNTLETKVIALDIEGQYNLHEYGEKLCLVQVCDGKNLVIIDPFNFSNETIANIFENPNILKVMYDASSDISLFKNEYNVNCKSILDLKPAVEYLGHERPNLHSVLNTFLGIELENKKKFQKFNWTIRPIDESAIEYAMNDVKYLLPLKEILMRELFEKGLVDLFFLRNLIIQQKDYIRQPGQRLRKSSEFKGLSEDERETFEHIFSIRERYAKQLNIPPHNLIPNPDIVILARNLSHLENITFSRKLATEIIKELTTELKSFINDSKE